MAGSVKSIRTYEIPECLGTVGSVRHRMNILLAYIAPEVQTFCPVMTISSPSTSPLVSTAARSDPWLGSEKPWQYRCSPEMIGGRNSAFCSGVPCPMMDG